MRLAAVLLATFLMPAYALESGVYYVGLQKTETAFRTNLPGGRFFLMPEEHTRFQAANRIIVSGAQRRRGRSGRG